MIYGLCDPDTGEVRYVGKANRMEQRLQTHCYDAFSRDTPVARWVRGLLAQGRKPSIRELERTTLQGWPSAERRMIVSYQELGANLLNVAKGGKAPHASPESCRRGAATALRLREATPWRKRLWALKRGIGQALRWARRHRRTDTEAMLLATMRKCALKRPDLFAKWAATLL